MLLIQYETTFNDPGTIISGCIRLRNDPCYVGWGVKLAHSLNNY